MYTHQHQAIRQQNMHYAQNVLGLWQAATVAKDEGEYE